MAGGARPGAGRPRKPVEQHVADGTFRKDRHAAPTALPTNRERPPRPPHFTAAQRDVWEAVCDDLADLGVLADSDALSIEMAATLLGAVRDIRRRLHRGVKDDGVFRDLMREMRSSIAAAKTVVSELGLSPAARHRLGVSVARAQGPKAAPTAAPASAADALGPSPRLALVAPPGRRSRRAK